MTLRFCERNPGCLDMTGKVALVTGSSRGIGREIAVKLAQAGADVVINYLRNRSKAEETAAAIEEEGSKALIVRANVANEAEISAMYDEIRDRFGRLDILVSNAGVLIAEAPYRQDEMLLIIDIGTNGELILGNRQKLFSTSCATGPAFEGAEIKHGMRAAPGAIEKVKIDPKTKEVEFKVIGNQRWNTEVKDIGARGICGSGIFDVTAQMFLAGIIDKSGRFSTRIKSPRLKQSGSDMEFIIAHANETAINQDIVVCQKDIRAIQLAKGAMYSGAKLMMKRLGVTRIDKVVLAGAFGSYINKESAAVIGLFPDCTLENVKAVGNAAGDGACMALLDMRKRKEADIQAKKVEYVELTIEPGFNDIFTGALNFPHTEDNFPHLKHLLPKQ